MKRVIAHLLACLIAGSANAGAWPRGDGNVFLSFGQTASVVVTPVGGLGLQQQDMSLFFEYGLTDELTAGLDLSTGDGGRMGTGFVFARHPILQGFTDTPMAATVAIGVEDMEDGITVPLLRAGVSWGRGLDKGWLAVDTFYTTTPDLQEGSWKSDVTIGRRFGDRIKGIAQFQTGTATDGTLYTKFAPSAVVTVFDGLDLELGVIQPLEGGGDPKVKLGVWVSF